VAHLTPDRSQVNARIVFWGIAGAGVSSNLRVIHQKLRADHRGELKSLPTRLDPSTHYEVLPIELGQVNGLRTQLQVLALPGGPEHAPTRKQLLDQVDGIVFVVDSRPSQVEANLESLVELREALEAYGRELDELPVVVQYNKRDESDPYVIEELHRQLDLPHAAVFEAVSTSGKGVLQTLTTISKRVVRVLRDSELETREEQSFEPAPPEHGAPEPRPARSDVHLMEEAILAEASQGDAPDEALVAATELDEPWSPHATEPKSGRGARIGPDFEIVSAGQARLAGQRSVELPLVLGNPEGETVTLRLTVSLDPLLDGEE
jgi:hypothetical protein